jgi:hypothetical protein
MLREQVYDSLPACVAEPLLKATHAGPHVLGAAVHICVRTADYVQLLKDLGEWTPEDDARIWNLAADAIRDQRRCLEYSVGPLRRPRVIPRVSLKA